MRDTSVFLPLERYFQRIGLRSSVVLCQLPLTITMVIIVAVTEWFTPETMDDPTFRLTLVPHILIFVATLAVPWHRLPEGSFLVIPLMDCLALGATYERGGSELAVVGLLIVFPVIWLAVSTSRVRVLLAVVSSVVTALVPHFLFEGGSLSPREQVHVIVLPTVIGAVALTAHVVAKSVVRQRETLESKDRDLQQLYQQSWERQRLLDTVVETVSVGVWVVDSDGNDVLVNRRLLAERARIGERAAEEGADSQGKGSQTEDRGRAGNKGLSSVRTSANAGPDGGNAASVVFLADGQTPIDVRTDPVRRAARGEAFSDELYWIGNGRDRRAFSGTARPLKDDDGSVAGSVIAFTDVTALVNALGAKDNFVATISHELRTPLTSILGYLELAFDEPDPDQARASLEVIERNATRLLNLVNDLLSVASGGVELNLKDTDFADIVARSLSSAKPHAAANGVHFALEADRPLPAKLDPNRIGQVLDNLLSNAIKYSPDGGLVTVSAHVEDGFLECTVADSGIGMDAQEQEQAFTKFFRASRAMETAIPGAGLGLPISKTIVEGHGGTIELTSTPGKGTKVTFTIPTAPANQEVMAE